MTDLAELKAENAAKEEALETPPQEVEEETEIEAAEEEVEPKEDADPPEGETETEVESWMQGEEESSSDDQTSHAEKKFTDHDVANARRKWQGKAERREDEHQDEVQKMQARIRELEAGAAPVAASDKPKRDDFLDADDQDEAFAEAMVDWKMDQRTRTVHAQQQETHATQQALDQTQATQTEVDQHYMRAVTLAEKSGITPEQYKTSDLRVRNAFEAIAPNAGNIIVEHLISVLGEGSEKVMYNLGVNNARLLKVVEIQKADPTGLRAAVFLGSLKSELGSSTKRTTKAPAPAANPKGDQIVSSKVKALQKKYAAAHKNNDVQAAFDARKEAKQAGVDVKEW